MRTCAEIEHAPVNDKGNHTSYGLYYTEPYDGTVFAFPEANWAITTEEHKADELKERGLTLLEGK
jgi:hypothetical protein